MTHDPWQSVTPDEEPSLAALAGVDLMPKQGGYSLQDILQLHDTALHVSPSETSDADTLPTVGSVAGPVITPDDVAVADSDEPVTYVPAPAPEPLALEPETPDVQAPPMPAINPFAAFSMPIAPQPPSGPRPAKRGGLPMIDPDEFASAAVDRLDPVPAPAEPEELTVETLERASEVQLHALQQSLAALDELEAQLTMLAPETPPEPEPTEWVDALATTAPSPPPLPFPTETAPKPLIGPTTADDVVADDDEDVPFSPAPIERLEPAVQFPFPGMGSYSEEPAVSIAESLPVIPAPNLTSPSIGVMSAGDPPFFFHLDGESVDLATDMGIAACEEAARSAIADAGRAVQTMLDGQQRQRRMHELMSRVHAGGLSIDEVIGLGQELQRLRDEIGTSTVDRRAVSELVARLEQQRALMGRLIDLLWRT